MLRVKLRNQTIHGVQLVVIDGDGVLLRFRSAGQSRLSLRPDDVATVWHGEDKLFEIRP